MISTNKYKKILRDVFKQHPQINTVLEDDEFNFNAASDIVYPVINIAFIDEKIRSDQKIHQFNLTIADIYDPNIEGHEDEIINDANQIADDILTYFESLYDGEYDVLPEVSINNFSNGNVDRIAGCVFGLNFTQFRESDVFKTAFKHDVSPVGNAGFPYSFPFSF